jgi:MoxR-like ATPase
VINVAGLDEIKKKFSDIFSEIDKVVIGQRDVVEQVVTALLCNGHAYIEGYPGLAKTMIVKTLAGMMDLEFGRIQGTPDLLPSDITGTYIIDESKGKKEFKFQKGPIFANLVLVDEVNRATPKSHSAILEAMQERQVTVGNSTYKLDPPFFVLATANPIEQEGTFRLSEAQVDRFLFKININYPKFEDEIAMLERYEDKDYDDLKIRKIFSSADLLKLQDLAKQIPISNDLKKYIVKVVTTTRNMKEVIEYGASPRATLALVRASKARALINGRKYATKEDIEAMAYPILRHRIILSFDTERKGISEDEVIRSLLKKC